MSLWQEVKDTVDGQRILEKKGSAAVSWRDFFMEIGRGYRNVDIILGLAG